MNWKRYFIGTLVLLLISVPIGLLINLTIYLNDVPIPHPLAGILYTGFGLALARLADWTDSRWPL